MRNYFFFTLIGFVFLQTYCSGQEAVKDVLLIKMETVPRMQPNKKTSIGIPKKAIKTAGYPKTKGRPLGLKYSREFYYIFNVFQFNFQNYCAKKISRSTFLEFASSSKWNLSDTLYLSRKPIKCGISILTGLQHGKVPVYLIDANNNSDYSDEVIRPLRYNIEYEEIINSSVPVLQEFYLRNQIVKEQILCYVDPRVPVNQLEELALVFPEFRYHTFIVESEKYTLWSPTLSLESEIYLHVGSQESLIPNAENPIKPGQYVTLGSKTLKYLRSDANGNQIVLVDEDKNFVFDSVDQNFLGSKAIFSSQVGFNAPPVKGANINNLNSNFSSISTDSLKGKYVFLDFWSTTCGPCIADFPEIMKSYHKYSRNEFEIIGIVDDRTKDGAIKILKKHQVLWPNVKINVNDTFTTGYFIGSYPTTFLIDPYGKVIAQNLRGNELFKMLGELLNK